MSYADIDREALDALGRVIELCLPKRPCNRKSCLRCAERVRQDALQEADLNAHDEWWEAE